MHPFFHFLTTKPNVALGIRIAATVVIASSVSAPQETMVNGVELSGIISSESGSLPRGLGIELHRVGGAGTFEHADVLPNGSFKFFEDLKPGTYECRILSEHGAVIYRELISLPAGGMPITLHLPTPSGSKPIGGMVSANELLRKKHPKALKEFKKARASKKGNAQEAVRHLQEALRFDPDFFQAHSNLGTQYARLGRYAEAIEEFQTAVDLEPSASTTWTNLSVALQAVGEYEQGEEAARRALEIEPRSLAALYSLGSVLAKQGKDLPEAIESLRAAARVYPQARWVAANLLVVEGSVDEAIEQLRRYLASGHEDYRPAAAARLEEVQR